KASFRRFPRWLLPTSESEGGLTERLSANAKSARSTCFPATSSNSDTDSSPLHEKRLYQRPPKSVTVSDAGDRLLVKVDADEVHCRAPGLGKRGHGQNSSSLPQDQRFCKPSRRPSPPSRRPSPPSHSFNFRPAAMRRKQV